MNRGNAKKYPGLGSQAAKPKHPRLFFAGNSADVAAQKIYCIYLIRIME